jgi:prepilin-type N-terminal cleavage/methylation domain-containing protein
MHRSEGFTLVELLVTIGISGLIFSISAAAIFQLTSVTDYGNSRLDVLHDQQNAAFWFNQDGQQSQKASIDNGLVLSGSSAGQITYKLSGNTLERICGNSTLVLGQNIGSVAFAVDGNMVSMHLISRVTGRMEESVDETHQVYLRAHP